MALSITLEMLGNAGACKDSMRLFQRIFGEGAELTPENIEKAWSPYAAKGFGVDDVWAAGFRLLTKEGFKAFEDEYDKLLSQVYDIYTIEAFTATMQLFVDFFERQGGWQGIESTRTGGRYLL